jgi:DNA-binding response OmpR family regulator
MLIPILVLASDPSTGVILRRAAEEFGRVVVTTKPAMAIYRAAVHDSVVAILDLDAVPPDGRSGLISTLRSRFKTAVVGVGEPSTIHDAEGLGLSVSLVKPVNVGELMAAVDRLLNDRLGKGAETRGM